VIGAAGRSWAHPNIGRRDGDHGVGPASPAIGRKAADFIGPTL
jgi:hypothetical protein